MPHDVVKTIFFLKEYCNTKWDQFHSNRVYIIMFDSYRDLMLSLDLLLITHDWYIVNGSSYIKLALCEIFLCEKKYFGSSFSNIHICLRLTPVQPSTLNILNYQRVSKWHLSDPEHFLNNYFQKTNAFTCVSKTFSSFSHLPPKGIVSLNRMHWKTLPADVVRHC